MIGREIDPDRLARRPVTGCLKDRRTRQPAMGEQRCLAKPRLTCLGHDLRRHARQFAEQDILAPQRQRHQRGARFHHLKAELPRDVVGIARGTHLRNGRPAGRHHQRGGAAVADGKQPVRMAHRGIGDVAAHLHIALRAFFQQHGDDLPGRTVAEQLPQRLFVPGDAMAFHQIEEVARGISAERGFREVRVLRQVPIRRGVDIGEIAPPAAGNQDLLARLSGTFQHHHPFAELACAPCGHQARRAAAQNDRIVIHTRRLAVKEP